MTKRRIKNPHLVRAIDAYNAALRLTEDEAKYRGLQILRGIREVA